VFGGRAGLALLASTHILLAQAIAQLSVRRPAFYLRHRELLGILMMLHLTWMALLLALRGGTALLQYHGGSPLSLLGLIVAANPALWVLCYSLYARLLLRGCAWRCRRWRCCR
jgi:hypothetical protein